MHRRGEHIIITNAEIGRGLYSFSTAMSSSYCLRHACVSVATYSAMRKGDNAFEFTMSQI